MLFMGCVSWTGLELCRASTDISLFQHLVVVGFEFVQDKVCRQIPLKELHLDSIPLRNMDGINLN
jgi:hypothetical protein